MIEEGKLTNLTQPAIPIAYLCAMPLYEEMVATGNWLFRNRSYIPIVLYVFAVVAIFLTPHDYADPHSLWFQLFCLLISMAGLLIRALTIGRTPKGTSGRNTTAGQVAESLNTTGMYSIVRHPLYLGNFLMWLGLIVYAGSPWFTIFSVFFFWIYYERIMMAEEAYIRTKFNEEYESWAAKVPAFFPKMKGWIPSDLNFSLRNVLKREYSGLFATFLSFAILNILKEYQVSQQFRLDSLWMIGLLFSAVALIILRTMKKKTDWLNVEGR